MSPQMATFLADIDTEVTINHHNETVQRALNCAACLVETEINTLDQAGFLVPGMRAALLNLGKQIRAITIKHPLVL